MSSRRRRASRREEEVEEEQEQGEQAHQELDAPFVVQCGGCRRVCADSWSYVDADQEDRTYTVSKACNVSVGANEVEHNEVGSFKRLLCSGCGHVLGRVYETATRSKSTRAGMFTFDLDSVTSYKLGSAMFDMLEGEDVCRDQGALAQKGLHLRHLRHKGCRFGKGCAG